MASSISPTRLSNHTSTHAVAASSATTHNHSHKAHRRGSASSTKKPGRANIKRPKSGTSKKRVSIVDPEEASSPDIDDMTTSFPQFCTLCEKQIITPNNTLLYCSENCRRKDQNKPLGSSMPNASHLLSRPLSYAQSHSSSEHMGALKDIIPQRSPTISANRFSFTDLFSAGHETTDDEAQVEQSVPDPAKEPKSHRRQDSEAARYLRQFQSPSFIAENTSRSSLRRPNTQSRSSTYSLAPSLTHSPSPGTSPASLTPLSSLPLAYSRPLPPRANPYSQSYGAKGMGISLVTPHTTHQNSTAAHGNRTTTGASIPRIDLSNLPGLKAQPTTGTNVGADDLPNEMPEHDQVHQDDHYADSAAEGQQVNLLAGEFAKKVVLGSSAPVAPGRGALRSLFRFDEMQAPPPPPST